MKTKRSGQQRCWSGVWLTIALAACTAEPSTSTTELPLTGSGSTASSTIACGGGTNVTYTVSGTNIVDVNASDIMFIVDGSGSITAPAFQQARDFMKDVVNQLPVDANHRIGIITFSREATLNTEDIGTFSGDKTALLAVINSLPYPGATTCTECGLDEAARQFGAKSSSAAHHIGIVITDGEANNPENLPAALANTAAQHIELFSIGVGASVSIPQLNQIATDPDTSHVFTVTSYANLKTILGQLISAITSPEATNAKLILDVSSSFTASAPTASGGSFTQSANTLTWTAASILDQTYTLGFYIQHASAPASGSFPVLTSYSYSDSETNTLSLPVLSVTVGTCDRDGDTIPDANDNCPDAANTTQVDQDHDGIGDACDLDIDGDTIPNTADNCPTTANTDQADADADGIGNVCDPDDDNDGVPDTTDQCPGTPAGTIVDTTGCAIAQLCPCNNNWQNHGKYVSCVTHAASDFLAAGLITAAQKGAIVSAAAQSSCGK
jgi:hypothetical protein